MSWLEAISLLVGGGVIGVVLQHIVSIRQLRLQANAQDSAVARQLRDELRDEIQQLRTRLDHVEAELLTERQMRAKAELDAARSRLLMEQYRARLAKYESLPETPHA